ncbi:hypothetical protein THRCLA_05106 [Thraustotheca clavata]|uniref:Uncharacterized protein n=1 Tax=Thraustotheca clavata TaxID=74557 RepID=A0A1V9ZWX1_9STRA|nr:hypothetical protein THRCLA_05106 [Thraustotheca clavata]
MEVPVAIWSNCSLKSLRLDISAACMKMCNDTHARTLMCGTKNGGILLFRVENDKWALKTLLLRHKTAIAGLAVGNNEWGQSICVSVSIDGAIGLWLMADGRCLEWHENTAAEIAPIQGMQMVCNERYALVFSTQGRMLMVDTWRMMTFALPGTNFSQVRIDVGVTENRKFVQHDYDAYLISLGLEGMIGCFGWIQPVMTTIPSSTDRIPSYVWKEENSWIVSWAPEATDITCIETQIHPTSIWLHGDTFPIHVKISPNGQHALFVWKKKWAIFKRSWLYNDFTDNTTPCTYQGEEEWVDGDFTNNDQVVLWTKKGCVYAFPVFLSEGPTSNVYFFTKPTSDVDVEKPASIAFALRSASLPEPFVIVPNCKCHRSPFSDTFGTISIGELANSVLWLTFVCPKGCTMFWSFGMDPTVVSFVDHISQDPNKKQPQIAHVILGKKNQTKGEKKAALSHTPLLVHGFDDGHITLTPMIGAWSPPISLDCLTSAITCMHHMFINTMETTASPHHTSPPLYEGYADSPTSSARYPSTEKLHKISLLLHKLQHHQQTPKAALSPPSIPVHFPQEPVYQDNQIAFLLFTGSQEGSVGVSQLTLRLENNVVTPSAKLLHSFTRHIKPIVKIRVSSTSSCFGYLVACIGADQMVSIYSVQIDQATLNVAFFMECPGHSDQIQDLRWDFRTNHLFVDCADGLTYIWGLQTGVLERMVPSSMVDKVKSEDSAIVGPVEILTPARLPNLHVLKYELRDTVERLQQLWLASEKYPAVEMTLLSFALTWMMDERIDSLVYRFLDIHPPMSPYSIAITGPSGALTIPLPEVDHPHSSKWKNSSFVSAQLLLALVTMCTSFMDEKRKEDEDAEQLQVLWSQLITQHMVCLPEQLENFEEPSLEVLAACGFHEWEALQMASRLLLHGVIKRLPPETRSTKAAEYMTRFHCEVQVLEKDGGLKHLAPTLIISRLGSMLVVLSIMGTCFPGELSPTSARQVCEILVSLLQGPSGMACVAAELLAKGLLLFRPHLVDLAQLVVQLIPLTLDASDDEKKRLKQAAMRLLVELGTCEASSVLTVLQHEMSSSDRTYPYREGVLIYLMTWVNIQYLLMVRHIPAVVETILCCLDPTKPDRRKKCLAMSTKCLHDLVKRFPMVDFHKTTQRLAVGTMEGVVLLFDLRTATKWRVLEGHTTPISAVQFRKDGAMLISYSSRDASIRWWNITPGGILSLLKVQQSCVRHLQLAPLTQHLQRPAELHKVIQSCRFRIDTEDNSSNVWLTREDESILPLNFNI